MLKILLRSIVKTLIQQEKVINQWYFITLTFPTSYRNIEKEIKVKYVRAFFAKCKNKSKINHFTYFWVQEMGTDCETANLHVHAIINYNYSVSHMQEWWETILHVKAPSSVDGGDIVRDMAKVLDYMFKEEVSTYGMSGKWRSEGKKLQNHISNSNINYILGHEAVDLTQPTYKSGNEHEQLAIEQLMFENYINCSPDMMQWLRVFSHSLKGEKELFLSRLKPRRGSFILKNYINILEKALGEEWQDLLFYSIMYHVVLVAYYQLRIEQHEYIKRVNNILLSLLTREQADKYRLSVEGKEEQLGADINTLFEQGFLEYFNFEPYISKINSNIYKQIQIRCDFKDLPLNPSYRELKGWAPMVVVPKPWKLKEANPTYKASTNYFVLGDYISGGYLSNGIRFNRPLCKINDQNSFEYLTQPSLDCINYLQQQPLAINHNLLEFIQSKSDDIQTSMFPQGMDINILQGKYDADKAQLKQLYSDMNIYIATNFAHVAYDIKTAQGRDILRQLQTKHTPQWDKIKKYTQKVGETAAYMDKVEKHNSIIKITKVYATYEKFYYCYEVDFRGRIYPVSDYLNYQGDDLPRSLVYFHEKSVMNLYWFKLYCVRKEGLRLEINSASEMIIYFDSILQGKMLNFRSNFWWANTDHPWAMLNCCLEYERYKFVGEEYTTGLPIYLDATCSGSQLISLLFKLDDYAPSLNLQPSSSEQVMGDFYMEIIDKFRDYLDLNYNNTYQYEKIKVKLNNKKDWRKLLKHVIMTVNYGLTHNGMLNKLVEKNRELSAQEQLPMECIRFIHKHLYKYINDEVVFGSLQVIAKLTSDAAKENKYVQVYSNNKGYTEDHNQAFWSFKQHYNQKYSRVITTDKQAEGKKRITHQITYYKSRANTINKTEQGLSIKANLIHNLDAVWVHNFIMRVNHEQMFNGVLPIHDCFGVLMKDIPDLNAHVRKALADFFSNRENLYKLALQLARDCSKKPERSMIESALGKLHISLDDSFYLIFPG